MLETRPTILRPALDLSEAALLAANVNPQTGLATDYLNVFNETLMLLELAADDAMFLDDLLAWEYVDYPTHFQQSTFRGKVVAVAAWEQVETELRQQFSSIAEGMGQTLTSEILRLVQLREAGQTVGPDCADLAAKTRIGIAWLDGLIHGGGHSRVTSDEIDQLFA